MAAAEAMARRFAAAGVVAVIALATAVAIHREVTRPGTVFVRDAPHGEWIRCGDPLSLKATASPFSCTYRRRFAVSEPPHSAPLVLRTTGPAVVRLDGAPIAELPDPSDWNEPHTIELAPALAAGEHELEIEISHAGANALVASLEPVALETGPDWLTRGRDDVWRNAALAARPTPAVLASEMRRFERPALIWLAAGAAFALLFGALLARRSRALRCSPSQLRLLVLGIWALVAVNDFAKLPITMGMDVQGHLEYVKFILDRGALPLASDGWEMFQAPLYYLLCAAIASLSGEWNGIVVRAFWLISIACALAQIEIAYRLGRRVFPEREDLQKVAIAVSGLLPMGFAVSQGVGNEPLHAVLSALTLLFAARLVQLDGPLALRDSLGLGALWGLAMLAKATAALLALPLLYALWCRMSRRRGDLGREWASAAYAGIACAAVAGWYYLRNWIELGTPFTVGASLAGTTEASADFWWQETGYRLVAQLTRFGSGLVHPFDAASHGFWDNYYSTLWGDGATGSKIVFEVIPPWNYAPMLASLWLAIVPSALIVLGFARALCAGRGPRGDVLQMGAIALAATIAAVLSLYVQLPIYSQGKATYTLGLTPIFGVLAASGCEALDRSEHTRTAAFAVLAAWALLVISSYFVI